MKKVMIILILFLTGCQDKQYSKNLYYMDTVINIKLYNISEKKAKNVFNDLENLYKKYDELTNIYNENSELSKLNSFTDMSNELYELIEYGASFYDKTNGLLNINIGGVTKIWHDFRETGIFPSIHSLKQVNIDKIILKNKQITNKNFNIDLGAIVKGYVTQLAGEYLEENNILYYIISAGGNVKVGKSNKGYYNIGIASPNDNGIFMKIKGENISVVTSGGYERFYEYNGIKYHHIIDPNTLYPANYMKSVTVISKDSALADSLSTTLFLMDIESGKEFIKDYDVDVIWYTNDDDIIKTFEDKYE